MGIETNLILIAVIMFIGFVGNLIFKKTDIPNIIWLLMLGLLVGPVLGILPQEPFLAVSEFFAAVAIIIILFEGGINMDITKILRDAPMGGMLTIAAFSLSIIIVTLIMMILGLFIPGITILHGILLGAIVGGTSAAVVMPIVTKLEGLNEKTRMILSIESAITDILCIVVAIAVIQALASGSADVLMVFKNIAANFSVGIFLGLIAGMLWLPIMRKVSNEEFSYVTTFGVLFFIFAGTQLLGGSGAIACLTFGIVLGNGRKILSVFGVSENAYEIDPTTKTFHSLMSFFIRTFFFVFLGLLVSIQDPVNILIGILISAALLMVRPFAVKFVIKQKEGFRDIDKKIMSIMYPRGLAAAVLAYLPISQLPNDAAVKSFADIVFTVILATAIITTVGVMKAKRETKKDEEKKEEKEIIEEKVAEKRLKKPKVDVSPLAKKKVE